MVTLKNDHFKNGVKKFYEKTVKKNKLFDPSADGEFLFFRHFR